MSTIKQIIAHYRRRKAIRLIIQRHKRVNHHVYTTAEILPDCTTRLWICVDGTRIMLISDEYSSEGTTPCVKASEADKYIDFVKHQYYLTHRHKILRYEQS